MKVEFTVAMKRFRGKTGWLVTLENDCFFVDKFSHVQEVMLRMLEDFNARYKWKMNQRAPK